MRAELTAEDEDEDEDAHLSLCSTYQQLCDELLVQGFLESVEYDVSPGQLGSSTISVLKWF